MKSRIYGPTRQVLSYHLSLILQNSPTLPKLSTRLLLTVAFRINFWCRTVLDRNLTPKAFFLALTSKDWVAIQTIRFRSQPLKSQRILPLPRWSPRPMSILNETTGLKTDLSATEWAQKLDFGPKLFPNWSQLMFRTTSTIWCGDLESFSSKRPFLADFASFSKLFRS